MERKQAGFTLTEALLTLAVLSLLLAVVLASLSSKSGQALARSRALELIEQAKTIATATELYYADHNSWPLSPDSLVPEYVASVPSGWSYYDENLVGGANREKALRYQSVSSADVCRAVLNLSGVEGIVILKTSAGDVISTPDDCTTNVYLYYVIRVDAL